MLKHTKESIIILMGMASKKNIKKKRPLDAMKRDAILHAAITLFLGQGYSDTSMDHVALKAGVTKQTVYTHFHDKETLFTAMLTALCGSYVHIADVGENSTKPFEQQLYDIGLGYTNLISGQHGLSATRLIMSEAPKRPKLAKLFYENSTERMTLWLADFLQAQNKKGVTRIPNCRSAASYFFSLLKGRYHLRMALCIQPPPSEAEKIAHIKENVKIFMRLYCSENPMYTKSIL